MRKSSRQNLGLLLLGLFEILPRRRGVGEVAACERRTSLFELFARDICATSVMGRNPISDWATLWVDESHYTHVRRLPMTAPTPYGNLLYRIQPNGQTQWLHIWQGPPLFLDRIPLESDFPKLLRPETEGRWWKWGSLSGAYHFDYELPAREVAFLLGGQLQAIHQDGEEGVEYSTSLFSQE